VTELVTELVAMGPPLGPAISEAVGTRAKLHIVGGMLVEGRVVHYDPDLGIATVVDRSEGNFEIDVRCVAVLET